VKTAQMASALLVPLSGGGMRTLCRTPTYGPASLGRHGTAVVQRRHQPRRTRNGALRGVSPHYSCGPMDNVYGPGSSTESDVLPSMSPARKGGCSRGCDE